MRLLALSSVIWLPGTRAMRLLPIEDKHTDDYDCQPQESEATTLCQNQAGICRHRCDLDAACVGFEIIFDPDANASRLYDAGACHFYRMDGTLYQDWYSPSDCFRCHKVRRQEWAQKGLHGICTKDNVLDVAMACVSVAIMKPSPTDFAAGFHLLVHQSLALDSGNVGIYVHRKLNRCVLAFSGTRMTMADWSTNLDMFTAPMSRCKARGVHRGFALRMNRFVQLMEVDSRFKVFKSVLSDSSTCGGGVLTTGFSLGGALASLMSACAFADRFIPFTVAATYTYAAPSISEEPLSANGDCLPGVRYYIQERYMQDPIPSIFTTKLAHPKMLAGRLSALNIQEFHDCYAHATPWLPQYYLRLPSHKLHKGSDYVRRVASMLGVKTF
eukprot:TRINITY_DN28641_c0_g1_i1.p1 TRINITY_DN28641_c0_g1~~TRINITY_DN28641_c0_g1_i1.p1  ORF type:complete len:406 (-),score=2.99 TRINITY_DN28641_c0_g1_i1:15-1169(-)